MIEVIHSTQGTGEGCMIEIIQGDCIDIAPDLPECDVMITDPPYSEHVHAHTASMGSAGAGPSPRELGFDSLTPELRTAIVLMAETKVARWSVLFSDLEGTHAWREDAAEAGLEYIREVPWVRWSQPQLTGDRPSSGAEAVLHLHWQHVGPRGGVRHVRKRWHGPGNLTAYSRRALRGKVKHKTEKPLDLMLDLVSWFSEPGDIVLDPCAGAGTTALACKLLGRSCIAIEQDPVWATHALTRVHAPLTMRDLARVQEWVDSTDEAAKTVPFPKGKHDVKTWKRAQFRLADTLRVIQSVCT